MDKFYNFLLVLLFISLGVYLIYITYKKPAPLYSTDMKGYMGGILFVILGILSLLGKFSILEVLKVLFSK
jgi:hypothetical protein